LAGSFHPDFAAAARVDIQLFQKCLIVILCFFKRVGHPIVGAVFNPTRRFLMQITFESRDPEAVQLQPVAERRVRLALRRLSWLAPRARVRMSDVNGPRHGAVAQLAADTK
jgi:hypothetical protein